jgi:probable HAF family extracellular repeat protein
MPAVHHNKGELSMPASATLFHRLFRMHRILATTCAAALACCIAPGLLTQTAFAAEARPATVRYRVANLGPGELSALPVINASGQVAFSLALGPSYLAYMFDGTRVRGLGTLGGASAYATGINDLGQISGFSLLADNAYYHAFRWSPAGGMLDLGTLDGGESTGAAINNKGDVVGESSQSLSPPHAFRWSATGGMEFLGTLATDVSSAVAVNDSSVVTGFSNAADGYAHTFVWTRSGGIEDIGTLGGIVSYPEAVGARGEVAGYSAVSSLYPYHAFLWTRSGGMRDLGAGKGVESFVLAMSPQTHIAGVINDSSEYQRAMSWTAATGMLDLGTFGGPGARAQAVNNAGQVVGSAMDKKNNSRAFLWTRAQGLADLNGRLDNAPAGLVIDDALSINDSGAIVAMSNAGLVLLRPVGQAALAPPVVGPVLAPGLIRVGAPVTMKVAFNDANPKELHRASLQWGDATMETALVTESGGAGTVAASHVYHEAGVYTIIARVTDAAGNTTTVTRDVVVDGGGGIAAGSGKVYSPLGAVRGVPAHAGPAAFRFVAPAAQAPNGKLQFTAPRLVFVGASMASAAAAAGKKGFTGTGKLNGRDGYRYAVTVAGGAAGTEAAAGAALAPGAFGLRIWHTDPVSKVDVVDYDNLRTRVAARGAAVIYGAIASAP